MIRLQGLKIEKNYKYWYYPLHKENIIVYKANKFLKEHIALTRVTCDDIKEHQYIVKDHIIKTFKDIDYLFFTFEV